MFARKGRRIDAEKYIDRMLACHFSHRVSRVAGDTEFQFQKENAAAHASAPAAQVLKKG